MINLLKHPRTPSTKWQVHYPHMQLSCAQLADIPADVFAASKAVDNWLTDLHDSLLPVARSFWEEGNRSGGVGAELYYLPELDLTGFQVWLDSGSKFWETMGELLEVQLDGLTPGPELHRQIQLLAEFYNAHKELWADSPA